MKKFMITLAAGIMAMTAVALYFQLVHRYQIQVSEHFVQNSQIPVTFDGARLIQLSDLRIENNRDLRTLELVVEQVNNLAPDMIALTGDVFGTAAVSSAIREETARLLESLQTDIGKVAVLGTLDLERESDVTELLEEAGFHVLRNESRNFYNGTRAGIAFLGLDPASMGNRPATLLPRIQQEGMFQILLTHEGQHAASIVDHDIGLKLSGYCLGRTAPAAQCSQFSQGPYRFAEQLVNISSGVGTDQSFFGFLKRPSIDSFLLIRQ